MAKKSSPVRIAPLQKVVAESVTDPSEQAALDQQRRQRQKGVRTRGGNRTPTRASSPVLELFRQLPAEERPSLLVQVAASLSPEEQLEMLEALTARLPADAARKLEEELRAHLLKPPA
ncbi:MAG: hypothetical protein HYS12_16310 [Planctomycetes bacterium]|nr:hypothetical protein [Planctomycetota bacterium]